MPSETPPTPGSNPPPSSDDTHALVAMVNQMREETEKNKLQLQQAAALRTSKALAVAQATEDAIEKSTMQDLTKHDVARILANLPPKAIVADQPQNDHSDRTSLGAQNKRANDDDCSYSSNQNEKQGEKKKTTT